MSKFTTYILGDRINFRDSDEKVRADVDFFRNRGMYSKANGYLDLSNSPSEFVFKSLNKYANAEWMLYPFLRAFFIFGDFSVLRRRNRVNLTKKQFRLMIREFFDDLHELRVVSSNELNVYDWNRQFGG